MQSLIQPTIVRGIQNAFMCVCVFFLFQNIHRRQLFCFNYSSALYICSEKKNNVKIWLRHGTVQMKYASKSEREQQNRL